MGVDLQKMQEDLAKISGVISTMAIVRPIEKPLQIKDIHAELNMCFSTCKKIIEENNLTPYMSGTQKRYMLSDVIEAMKQD